jgi:outer membrane protein OmpA-like peptidoglycan-associated protein
MPGLAATAAKPPGSRLSKNKKSKYIMKKNLLLFSLIFAMCTAFGQEVQTENNAEGTSGTYETSTFCPHHINIHVGEAWTNNIYKRVKINQYYSQSTMLDIDYAYFFNEHWGLGLGVGLNRLSAKASFSKSGVIPGYSANYDPEFAAPVTYNPVYDLYYDANGLKEKEVVWAVEIPLKAHFDWRFDGRNGIYAALGLQGYIPIKAFNKYKGEGTVTTCGYEELFNQWYFVHSENEQIKMTNHFGEASYAGKGRNVKMRPSIDILADFGGVFALNKVVDFYVGAYCKYGFLDILPKTKTALIGNAENQTVQFNGTLGSDMLDVAYQNNEIKKNKTKWNLLQIGLKAGFHFKACANPAEKSKKQIEKEILDELKKKSNEPIVITQDPQYIYIVPVCDQMNDENDDYLTPDDKAAINELSDVLSKTKILFDLDKDIPKISDYNDNINRTVAILKANPQLKLIVEGYTCDLGSEQHNRDLAQRRANNVRKLFIQKGVNPDQIETASYTVNDPQNRQNITDPSREEHRAAIFRIVKR